MKVVQVPIDEKLLNEIDLKARRFPNRATFIREAVKRYIRFLEDSEADAVYAAGYDRIPEKKAVARAAVKLAARSMTKESW